jgi:hypothetical protein
VLLLLLLLLCLLLLLLCLLLHTSIGCCAWQALEAVGRWVSPGTGRLPAGAVCIV